MKEHTVDQSLNRRGGAKRRRVVLGLLGVALLLSLGLGAHAALNRLSPKVPTRAHGFAARLAWYRHSGQMRADFRTAGAAFRFILGSESYTPSLNHDSSPSVAENAAPSLPKS